jgi:elongation factor P--(R)-beta-lysine ligase
MIEPRQEGLSKPPAKVDSGQLLKTARLRADAFSTIRRFFESRKILEVETPLLSRGVSLDLHIDFFLSRFHPQGFAETAASTTHYWQTSPEPHLKRLLCAGFPDIYQITKAFRNGESGLVHNPEFTMIEWYRRDFNMVEMEMETLALCQCLAGPRPQIRLTWEEAFQATLGLNPLTSSHDTLMHHPLIRDQGLSEKDFPEITDLWDFLMAHGVEPRLNPKAFTSIRHFPLAQAAQSKVHPERPELALRFEIFSDGLELGNGYQELQDASEYRRRFKTELAKRRQRQKPQPQLDESLLHDLEQLGLPRCSGVAVGLDRLLMVASEAKSIRDVLLFPWGEH